MIPGIPEWAQKAAALLDLSKKDWSMAGLLRAALRERDDYVTDHSYGSDLREFQRDYAAAIEDINNNPS